MQPVDGIAYFLIIAFYTMQTRARTNFGNQLFSTVGIGGKIAGAVVSEAVSRGRRQLIVSSFQLVVGSKKSSHLLPYCLIS